MTSPKTFLVTGATSGIGVEAARQLLLRGHAVILTYRDDKKLETVKGSLLKDCSTTEQLKEVKVDLSNFASVRQCANKVLEKYSKLDGLVLNAGVKSNKFIKTVDGFELTYQTNHLSHFLLCHLLLPRLLQSEDGRIVCVSSELHKNVTKYPVSPEFMGSGLDLSNYDPMQAYSLSKLYNIWFVRQLAPLLPPNVTCNAVTPGFVPATDLSRDSSYLGRLAMKYVASALPFATSLQEGARRVVAVCTDKAGREVTGKYFSKGAVAELEGEALSAEKASTLWDLSLKATDIESKYL